MTAQATDKFQKVGLPGSATTLSAPGYEIGDPSITVGATTNHPTDTGYTFAIDRTELVNGVQQRIDGTYCEFVGKVGSATTITDISKVYGDDQDYPAGSSTRVYIPVASERGNRLVDGILVHADQDGTLKAGAVDVAAVLADEVVETAKIKDDAVTSAKLAPSRTTDANGWTVYDYGTWKEYSKRITYSQSVAASSIASLTVSSNNFPVGITNIGTNEVNFPGSLSSTSFGADHHVAIEALNTASSTTFTFSIRNLSSTTRTFTGIIDVTIRER